MDKARQHDFVKGDLGEILDKGVNMLQYVDDTIFLLQDDENSVRYLIFILCAVEQISGLAINFHKSELFL